MRGRTGGVRRAGRAWATAAVAVLIDGTPVWAQATEAPTEPMDRWQFVLDLALTAAGGNESFMIFTSAAQIRRLETDRFELELDTQLRYGRSQGEEIARRAQGGLKFDLHPEATWSPFLIAQAEHDAIRALELRTQSGAGAKYTFWRDETSEASISLAGLYDREDLRDGPTTDLARWSWRAKGEKTFVDRIRVQHTTFYQPVWDSPGDYLVRAQTGVSTRLTDFVALTVAHSYDRDSTPPEAIGTDDQLVKFGLRFEF